MYKKLMYVFIFSIFINSSYAEDFDIKQGWNFYGAPTDIELYVFDGSCVDYIWKYNRDENNGRVGWQSYVVNKKDFLYDGIDIVSIKKHDGFWIKASTSCTVSINDVSFEPIAEGTPTIVSNEFNLTENSLQAGVLVSSEPNSSVTYRIVGGDDHRFFTIAENNYIDFITDPDYENPQDINKDNSYNLRVEVTKDGLSSNKDITINVKDDDSDGFRVISKQDYYFGNGRRKYHTIKYDGTSLDTTVAIDTSSLEIGAYTIQAIELDESKNELNTLAGRPSETTVINVPYTVSNAQETLNENYVVRIVDNYTNYRPTVDSTPLAVNTVSNNYTKLTLTGVEGHEKAEIVEAPANGTLVQTRDGEYWYRPNIGATSDTFSYRVTNGVADNNANILYSENRVVNITVQ